MSVVLISIIILSSSIVFFPLPQANAASLALDTSATQAGSNVATSIPITIGNHSDRLLLVQVSYGRSAGESVTSVKIGTTSFTKAVTENGVGGTYYSNTDVWYLTQNAGLGTGPQTITVVYAGSPSYAGLAAISLYNANQTKPIGATVAQGGSTINPSSISITPTYTNTWLFAMGASEEGLASPTQIAIYTNAAGGDGDFTCSAQYNSNPPISTNTFSWTSVTQSSFAYSLTAVEVLSTSSVSLGGGGTGITSINGDTTQVQTINQVNGNTTVTHVAGSGTTTINLGSNVLVKGGDIINTKPSGTFKISAQPGVAICIGTGC